MRFGIWLCLLVLLPLAQAIEHPFTLFTADQVPGILAKMTDGRGPDDAAMESSLSSADLRLNAPESTLFSVSAIGSRTPIYVQEQVFAFTFGDADKRTLYRDKCRGMAAYLVDHFHPDDAQTNDYPEQDNPWILFALAIAYDNCYLDVPVDDPGRSAVRAEIEDYLEYAFTAPWPHDWDAQIEGYANGNFHANIGGSMLMGVLSIMDDGSDQGLYEDSLSLAQTAVQGYIAHTLGPSGGCSEGVGYCALSMAGLTYGVIAQKNYDGTDFFADPRVERFLTYLAYNAIPEGDGLTHNWNDWPTYTYGVIRSWHMFPTYAMTRFPSPLSRFVHEHFVGSNAQSQPFLAIFGDDLPSGDLSLSDSMVFSGIGQYFYKSGWDFGPESRDIQFTFYSGEFMMGHNQEDKNTFTLIGYKERLIVDTGDSESAGSCSDPASRLEGHNLILVDPHGDYWDANGNGQEDPGEALGFLGMAKSSGNCGTDGYLRSTFLSNVSDFLQGDAREAYVQNDPEFNPWPAWSWCAHPYNGGTSTSAMCIHPKVMERANRYFLVIKPSETIPPYFVLADDTRTSSNQLDQYRFLLHTEYKTNNPAYMNTWQRNSNPLKVVGQHGGFLDVFWVSPAYDSVTFADAQYNTDNRGTTNPPYANQDGYNRRLDATIASGNPQWFMVFFPYDSQMTAPQYTVLSLSQGLGAELAFSSATDYLLYAPEMNVLGSGFDGELKMGFFREVDGLPMRFSFSSVSRIAKDGRDIVTVTGIPAHVSSDGRSVVVGSALNEYVVFGPEIGNAFVDGVELPVYKAGDYALITTQTPLSCSDQGGFVCEEGQTCTGEWEFAADSDLCCAGICEGGCPGIPPDVNCDYLIDTGELTYMIQQWVQGISPMEQLISVMEWWKASAASR